MLHAAWLVDTQGEHAAREAIAACKIQTANVLKSIGLRAIQVHGGLGLTDQMPLTKCPVRRYRARTRRRADRGQR